MTRILAIETSTEACSVALNAGAEVLERFELAPMKHAELLLPFVRGLLADAGCTVRDVDLIAFGRGPGSFTSLRIGIGVVQGLAWGADRPVVPVSSLAAVAQGVVDARTVPATARILVAMDARMGEVFHAAFRLDDDGRVVPDGNEGVSAPESLSPPGEWLAAGNGFERYGALSRLAERASASLPGIWPRAAAVLGRLPPETRPDRILAGPAQPPARPVPLHPAG